MAPTTHRPPKTVEDYMALPDDVRAELIGGDLYVTPSPTPRHQTVVQRLHLALAPSVESGGLGEIYVAPLDVHLPTGDVVQPDLLFIAREHLEIVQDWIRGAPDLVIEVVSKTHVERDRIVKHGVYERARVPELWLVDPGDRTLEVFLLEEGAYQPAGFFDGAGLVRTSLLPGLEVDVERLLVG